MNQRQIFLQHVAQTSPAPLALEIVKASGVTLTDKSGREYIDLIAGISVCNVGHCHPRVVKAIRQQTSQYLHLLVYGEFIETPQVQYAKLLTDHLPDSLNCVYFTNSGAEAVEGAMKLAKRVTGRTTIIAFNQSYHGSTQGALSIIGDEYWRNAFRPLLPGILHMQYNDFSMIDSIDHNVACVILETVQAERGIFAPSKEWLSALRKRCSEVGTLLIMDEIQTGFGRTGHLWGFEAFGIVPDIILLGKALGGGMPLGAFITDKKLMDALTDKPVLGHITTFGGHPVCCAAGMAAMKVLLKEDLIEKVAAKEVLFRQLLQHPAIRVVRSRGLLIAVEFDTAETCKRIIDRCIENGVLTDWFLFAANCLRIAPPLTISKKEIKRTCEVLLHAMGNV
ncbi:aspartate aminotransferase family protein [Flavihumibacter solisilvae]|uniref:Aminotransferase class III n=1 Tax=Flavihumibacter solisilvae TaxID=1349421 RepID=A0A0C1J059_9BACT|nr:aspartate aminotransferase family protein [Flavihumibacter solisilvae]KIC96139.1 aminotransferase class III [Flavihumibacter solisilvae]